MRARNMPANAFRQRTNSTSHSTAAIPPGAIWSGPGAIVAWNRRMLTMTASASGTYSPTRNPRSKTEMTANKTDRWHYRARSPSARGKEGHE
jgi:hypothetical protein